MIRGRSLPLLAAASIAFAAPSTGEAQFADPCEIQCAAILGVSSYAVATGAMIAAGRATGGLTHGSDAVLIWTASFAATFGTGMALGGDGDRQQRAVHGSGVGLAAGSLGGLLIGSIVPDADSATRLAGTLIGAGAGALIGGAIGALTYEGPQPLPVPLFSIRMPL